MTCMPAAVHEVAGAEAGAPDQCREQSPPRERKGVPEELSLRPPCRQPAADEEGEGRKSINMQLALR